MERSDSTVTYVEVPRSLVPLTWDNAVRQVGLDECEVAGRSLAHSFAADALSQYLLDGDDLASYSDEQKWKLHVVIMNTVVTSHILGGCVTTIGPDHDALAVWFVAPFPPGLGGPARCFRPSPAGAPSSVLAKLCVDLQ